MDQPCHCRAIWGKLVGGIGRGANKTCALIEQRVWTGKGLNRQHRLEMGSFSCP